MIPALKKLFAADPYQLPAHEAYVALVNQSRLPYFYARANVPDTIDGRFDVIALHMFLLSKRLKWENPEFTRALWECFFSDMDRSLREMGASDTGIGKRIKKMVQAFYGRIDAYENSINDDMAFKESIKRNLYRGADIDEKILAEIAAYAGRNSTHLARQSTDALVGGNVTFVE